MKFSSRCIGLVVPLVFVAVFAERPVLADEIFYTARNDGSTTVAGIAPGHGAIQHLTTPSTLVTIVGTSIQPDSLVFDGNLIVYTLNGTGVNQAQMGIFDQVTLTNTVFNLPGNGSGFPPGAQPRDVDVNDHADPTGNTVTYGDFNTGIIYNVNLTTHVATPFITGLGPNGVQGIVFDTLGDLYAVTANGTQVQEFSPLGILLHTSATLSGLDGLTFDASTSTLYASDKTNLGFQKFSADLSTHTLLGTGTGLVIPDGIQVGVGTLAGNIFIADFGAQKIVKETTGGSFVASFDAPLIDDLAPFANKIPTVPEPGTFALIGSTLLMVGAGRRFLKRRS